MEWVGALRCVLLMGDALRPRACAQATILVWYDVDAPELRTDTIMVPRTREPALGVAEEAGNASVGMRERGAKCTLPV